ncbi:MAG: hypothetical protein WCO90_12620 [Planctomycetota bacterium]
MFTADGGTQALRRTMAYVIDIGDGDVYEISIPDELAALVLKGAAHLADKKTTERHYARAMQERAHDRARRHVQVDNVTELEARRSS